MPPAKKVIKSPTTDIFTYVTSSKYFDMTVVIRIQLLDSKIKRFHAQPAQHLIDKEKTRNPGKTGSCQPVTSVDRQFVNSYLVLLHRFSGASDLGKWK